jgi:hypothetical protein
LCTWAQPTAGLGLLGQAAQALGHFGPRPTKQGGIPLIANGSPAKSGRATIVGRWGSCLGANPVDGDPDLGRRVAGGSTELGCDGDGGRAEGCAGEGVGRLPLARLVRSASTSELERRYWRGRRDQRSIRDGGRRWPVKRRMRWPVTS